jgi:hypothetical protein
MQGDPASQSESERGPAAPADAAEAQAIVARYREQHPVVAEQLEAVTRTVQQALGELRGPVEAPDNPAAPIRGTGGRDEGITLTRWRRAVMALIAAALLVLFWHRLVWIG